MVGFLNQRWEKLRNLKRSDGERLYSRSVLLVIAAIFLISGLSIGENLEYCYDHPTSIAGWSDNATLPKFDPGLGQLTSAKVLVNYTIVNELNFSNTRDNPANITVGLFGNLSLTLPDKTSLVVESKMNRTMSLNPKEDKALNESSNESQSFALHQLDGFVGSSSADTVLLPITAKTFSSIQSSSVIIGVVPRASASICIIYEFVPARGKEISNSGTGKSIT